jgi:TolB-like protein
MRTAISPALVVTRATSDALARTLAAPLALTALLASPAAPGSLAARAAAADAEPSAAIVFAFRQDPIRFFFDLRATEAIQCGQIVLKDTAAAPDERRRVLATLATIYLSTDRREQARAACLEILADDPRADLDRPETLPPPVVRLFYGLRDSLLLASGKPGALDIRTLAVGDIENNSVVRGRYDLDRFARGLSQILITDLKDVTPLTLVDRQRLDVLRDEIEMSANEQIMDAKYRVPLGQLTGAQSFLFGSVMQVSAQKIRLDLRWVDTATGEVLLSEGIEGKLGSGNDLFKLERKILLDLLVPQIEEMLSGSAVGAAGGAGAGDMKKKAGPYLDARRRGLAEGASYVDVLLKTGEAVLAEERGDLAAAEAAWADVRRMSSADSAAEGRAMALQAYRRIGAT